jgi:DNA topoisomerase-1
MSDARGETVSVRVGATASDGRDAEFGTAGTVITFRGFMLAYEEGRDEAVAADEEERRLPALAEGDALSASALEPESHTTTPPPRYTEATLVRALEERGIGRPSTYASILGTILDRGYVRKVGQALVPTFLAFAVTNLLEQHFGHLVDYEFTAQMEDDLDRIAEGDEERTAWLRRFYFGDAGDEGLKRLVSDLGDIDARAVNTIEIGDGIELRVGRYGPYIERDGERVTISDEIAPDELTVSKAEELLSQASDQRELGVNPDTGRTILVKNGRYGPYVTEDAENGEKPKTASLFKAMSPETVTLEDVLPLLALPRTVGKDGEGEDVIVSNGRYGPFVKRGSDTRSLESEQQLLTITLDEALALLAQPKERGRRAAAAPLRELGPDPVSGKPLVVKDGRFGPYVTDGETNASLRAGDSVETLTLERALELMAARRERGPATKPRRKRS